MGTGGDTYCHRSEIAPTLGANFEDLGQLPEWLRHRVQNIRWLHDQSKCAVALFATWQFAEEISSGSMEVYFEQLLGRIADPLYLPQEVMISECRAICQAYVSRPSAELVKLAHTIANQPGRLRILFELLEQSAILARAKKEKLQARHLTAAWKRRSKVRTNWE